MVLTAPEIAGNGSLLILLIRSRVEALSALRHLNGISTDFCCTETHEDGQTITGLSLKQASLSLFSVFSMYRVSSLGLQAAMSSKI